MILSRRAFLGILGMAAPVAAVAPKYFFAPVGGWKSDLIVNPAEMAAPEIVAPVWTVDVDTTAPWEWGDFTWEFDRLGNPPKYKGRIIEAIERVTIVDTRLKAKKPRFYV